ncbi:hypothetical protein AB0K60_31155 [Thermopolyspora sp. NPDC052614]|uniref:hypothetical protein n=1 Tax=Thermopolyspora sp. NPDC052614 TaxID=3155682 RepID=UPI0034274314
MTPFMVAVAETCRGAGEVAPPRTVRSRPRSVGAGTERQVAARSLAEQLVCEANAVLSELPGPSGIRERIELRDEPGEGALEFVLRVRGREARVRTTYADGVTRGWLRWITPDQNAPGDTAPHVPDTHADADAESSGEPAVELAEPEDVEALILRLLAGPVPAGRIGATP